jgi:hypothetical protein
MLFCKLCFKKILIFIDKLEGKKGKGLKEKKEKVIRLGP